MALPRIPMVQFLVQKGYLKPEQLDEAQKVAQNTGQTDISKVLVSLNMVGEREVLQAKAQEMGYAFADLDRVTIDTSAINVVPERLVKAHNAIPVKKDGQNLWVAMSNPGNIMAQDDIKMASGCRVIPVLAVPGAIEDAIKKYYGGGVATPEVSKAADTTPAGGGIKASGLEDMKSMIAQAGVQRGREEDGDADADAEKMAEQAPIIKLANALIQTGIIDRASDIHVEPQQRGVRVRYRIDGVLQEAMTIPRNLMAPLISRFKIMADMNIAERRAPQDGRIEVRNTGKEYDLRVSAIPTPWGEKIVMRILDKSSVMIGLNKIGFTEENQIKIEELVSQPNGMFLCTGPTGSGKTTTLYSVLHKLNTIGVNIVTAEDPIEYQLNGIAQVQMNRKANLTFATALRAFLRQDPDIMMVGEIRDLETAEIAIEASLTGHMVLSTLHTNDAPSSTLRLIDMGIEPYLIAATLIGVLAQRLGRRIDVDNREPYEVTQADLRRFGFEVTDPEELVTLYRGIPAESNRMTGYRGRTGFHELMVMNGEIAEMVVRRAPLADIKAAAKANGMKELREDGLGKVLEGITDPTEVMRVVFTAGF
ncbi:GspE/PulE family protein [Fimbriimonas ginsengisoli]|uniref:Type II secretion system protein E n=1 Tax=Fimbriimonas ginsengisoli Gsoil 348 TaxID=661478 RepID=A0A068NSL3_FIMGI|nr:ATPase, T2SS/T4P/T4SS family [Fimbriimonas ginsengisoli]AIE85765.1 type II secretion system protein E [Fimbriimonas ginsengisoli Gsoil 348]